MNEGGNATYIVSASAISPQPITVNYEMSGKAKAGIDYTLSGPKGQVVIPAGQSSASVVLHAVTDNSSEPDEVARMKVVTGTRYKRSSVREATVKIASE